MDGITALNYIVKQYNSPVVMISSLTTKGADLTLEALGKGAIDFIPKPKDIFSISEEIIRLEVISKIKMAAKSKTNIYYKELNTQKSSKRHSNISIKYKYNHIIAIGTSTGGPRALQNVLPLLSENINGTLVVVQHMPPKFTKSLAERLNTLSNIKVKEGEEGDVLERGYCYIAPGDFHMKVVKKGKDYIIKLDKEPPIKGLRPAVDVLMESVAKINDLKKVGIIMTGMGSDGSRGIVEIKKTNGYTIAQDEATSVVYGMPKSAIDTKHIDKIVPLNNIAQEIMSIVGV